MPSRANPGGFFVGGFDSLLNGFSHPSGVFGDPAT